MNLIDGIGGVFLFSDDPKRLATWYRDCLGIVPEGEDGECNSIYTTFECRDIRKSGDQENDSVGNYSH